MTLFDLESYGQMFWPPFTDLKNLKIQNHFNIGILQIKRKPKTIKICPSKFKVKWPTSGWPSLTSDDLKTQHCNIIVIIGGNSCGGQGADYPSPAGRASLPVHRGRRNGHPRHTSQVLLLHWGKTQREKVDCLAMEVEYTSGIYLWWQLITSNTFRFYQFSLNMLKRNQTQSLSVLKKEEEKVSILCVADLRNLCWNSLKVQSIIRLAIVFFFSSFMQEWEF